MTRSPAVDVDELAEQLAAAAAAARAAGCAAAVARRFDDAVDVVEVLRAAIASKGAR